MNASFLWQECIEVGGVIPAEEKWAAIRFHRNRLLAQCDWTQLPDAPLILEEKQEWATYRQELRDITENFLLPDEVTFPTSPSEVQS